MLPDLRNAGVRQYIVSSEPENAVSAAPANLFGTDGVSSAVPEDLSAGPEVRQHLGDRPVVVVGGRAQL